MTSKSSAFTSAEVLTYPTAMWSGNSARHLRTSLAVIEAAREQPASRSGKSTFLSGERIAAVSAMKWTPQKTITSASVAAAWRERPNESPT